MEIINNVMESISLSIAKTQTLQYWSKRIIEVLQSKRKSNIRIEKVELLSAKDRNLDDTVYYAIAQIDVNHSLILSMDQTSVEYFILKDLKKVWDEFDYSIANSNLNEIISQLRIRPNFMFKELKDIKAEFERDERIELKFTTRLNQNSSSISLFILPVNLESYLHRYHDPKSKNLDAMMDVPITVRVELGNLQRKVKEIMEFTQGTLLELDQTINSSCKVIVNNHIIAQGDVVEVNGNFGVVMTKIDENVDFMK